jgi:ferredoxin-thioredoxin reductase catalytic subunit
MSNAVISELQFATPVRPWVSGDYSDFYFCAATVSYNDRREFALVHHGMVMVEDPYGIWSCRCCHQSEVDESVADKGC